MQPSSLSIPVRSRRQAMDWSLVLLSQGIESVIAESPDAPGWQLLVQPLDYDRAVSTLQQYRVENRRLFWQQTVPGSDLLFDWSCLFWLALLVLIHVLGTTRLPVLREAGVMDGTLVQQGQWWRLFTAVTLHGDLPHLLANLTTGLILLGLAMGSFGAGYALLATYLAGGLANLVAMTLHAGHRNLGASGMIMGALGLLTAQSFALWRTGANVQKAIWRGVLGGVLLLVLLGFNPSSDVVAHAAGFAIGLLFGAGLALVPEERLHQPLGNRLAEGACAALVALAWWLALRS